MTVLQLVEREQRRLRRRAATAVLALTVAFGAAILTTGILLLGDSRWIALPRALPIVLWVVLLCALLASIAVVLHVSRRRLSRAGVAGAIEREQQLRDGSLRGILEVVEAGALGRFAGEQMADRLRAGAEQLVPLLQRKVSTRTAVAAVAAVLGAATLLVARQDRPDGWRALAHPVSAWTGTLAAPLSIDAPSAVMRGEKVEVLVQAEARRTVRLFHRATGSAWQEGSYRVDEDRQARAVLGPVDADILLVAGDGRSLSDTVLIRVTDRPFLGDVSIRATYPAYLGRTPETLPVGEPASVPRGTILDITGHASVVLREVLLVRDEQDTAEMIVDAHRFRGRIAPRQDGRWDWHALAEGAAIQDVPPALDLSVVPDSAPAVQIVWPEADTVVSAIGSQEIEVAASDDHGLAKVILRSWRVDAEGVAGAESVQPLAELPGAAWSGVQSLDLSIRSLQPGDELHVIASAQDASPWAQGASSRELILRVPTTTQQRSIARAAADSAVAEAVAAASAQRELEQKTGEASRSVDRSAQSQSAAQGAGQGAMSYESAEQARSLAGDQEEMQQRIGDLQRAAADMEEQLRRAGALDSGLAERLAEVRSMLREAMTQELTEQMRRLEQAAQDLDSEEARRALADLAEQQRKLREQLEKSAEMIKRAAMEGAMQTLSDEARDIANREKQLADSLQRGQNAGQQPDLQRQTDELRKQMEELAQRLAAENASTGADRTQEAARQAQASLEALNRIASGRSDSASSSEQRSRNAQAARDAAQAMDNASQQMADARSGQIGEWKNELTSALDRAVQEMQQLSRQQDQLAQQAQQGADPGSLRGDQSAIQQGVQRVNEQLQAAAQKSSLLSQSSQRATSDAQNRAQQATQQTASAQSGSQVASAMSDAASAMQDAALSLARDRERANNAKSASGFADMIEQMQQLAQQQGGLNQSAEDLLQQLARMNSEEMSRELSRLGQQQRQIARAMEELADATGRNEALAAEARRIAQSLTSGLVDQATIQRQQQLFRRMLDAGLTLEQDEQDESGKREARAASGVQRFVPADGSASGSPAKRYREPGWEELRGLTADERKAVLDYFRKINGGSGS